MKKGKKLALLLGTATMALTGCDGRISQQDYQKKLGELALQIKNDMKDVNLDIYEYKFIDKRASWHSNSPYFNWSVSNGNKGDFLSFEGGTITNDIVSGQQLSLVVYNISESDYKYLSNIQKSEPSSGDTNDYYYYGDIDALQDVILKDTSNLYSVKNLETNTVLYSAENQNEMTDDGMEM